MKTFSMTLAWGENDEGHYHWAGQAENFDAALELARQEMDASYNEEYCNDENDPCLRGVASGEDATEYELVDYSEGANEFAAKDMLDALRRARDYIATSPTVNEPAIAELLWMVETALARGEGKPESMASLANV